jgi:molybdopterin-containing oxidoreductase family iron-sulfur binding subunit
MMELKQLSNDSALSRRTFLKLAGFAFAGATAAGCQRAPVQKAVPALALPEDVIPGRPLIYASTCGGCNAGCGLFVKTRDGRPIKLEGNPNHPLSKGGLCAAGQASILGLYDSQRLQHPLKNGARASWTSVDTDIRRRLGEMPRGQKIRFLSSTITSPATNRAIADFLEGFPGARHVVYDPFSCSAIREAHWQTHRLRILPSYRLEQADVIVSFDADFLGTWISPVAFAADYQAGRYLQGPVPHLSYHVQFESRLSLTGTKADQRLCLAPGEMGLVMTQLAARVAKKAGRATPPWDAEDSAPSSVPARFLDDLADRLWTARGRCLVLCGSEDLGQQLIANFLNHMLQSYGGTVDLTKPSYQNQSNDRDLQELFEEIRQRQVGALFIYRSNPLYDFPDSQAFAEGLGAIPLVVNFASRPDETAEKSHYVCPEPHYLETWSDAEAVEGVVSLYQPTFQPLGEPRSVLESLAAWQGSPKSAYDWLRDCWQARVYPRSLISGSFQEFWEHALRDGSVRVKSRPTPQSGASATGHAASMAGFGSAALASVAAASEHYYQAPAFNQSEVKPIPAPAPVPAGSFTLALYPKVGMRDGSHAYNPWLQELPDPITKITWDNYACLSPAAAAALGVSRGDVVRLEGAVPAGDKLELPVVIQPGQHDRVVAVAMAYGSKLSERFARIGPPWLEAGPTLGPNGKVGVNAAPLLVSKDGMLQHMRDGVTLIKANRRHALACTQDEPTLRIPTAEALGRQPLPIIRETTLPELSGGQARSATAGEDLWPDDHATTGPRWGLVIDLNACTGCSACVIACQVENNIPVVGKDEVRRHREMHWMRIDRYYSSPARSPVDGGPRKDAEVDVAHQPMLCQHCGNAPCEVVCPVLATVHSEEGLNQQVYNRCVGTRYCANNCPYKVRRFNWFDYAHDDQLQNLVLNPDVTVRSRGVMEKCTLCVQRIQETKIEARRLGHAVIDGDIQTACQQSCPTKVITFGDLNDPRSRAARLAGSARAYHVLEELNVQSAVSYLNVVRNRPAAAGGTP